MLQKTTLEQLSILIPIHDFNKISDLEYLKKCLNCIDKCQLFIPKEVNILVTNEDVLSFLKTEIKKFDFKINLLLNDTTNTDFYSQINFFTEKCDTEFFSVVEFDDEVSEFYLKAFNDYYQTKKDISVFIPMVIEIDKDDKFIKFTNSEALSRGFITEGPLCYLPHELSKMLKSTLISGSFFKTEDLKEIGGFKTKLSLSNNFEFLMRATYTEKKVFVIPKLIYLHKNGRENSALDLINKSSITKEDVLFWYEIAQKEFFFKRDRDVEFTA